VAATAFGGVAPGPRPSPHRPRSMLRRSGSWRATPADPLAEHGVRGRRHQGAEHHRRGDRRHPDASNPGDVVKARGGTPGINRAASIARKPRRSSKAWTSLPLARRMTVASSCVRPAVRASAKAASTVPENIAGVSRIHVRRAIACAATLRPPHRRRPPSTCRHPSDRPCRTWRTYASPRPGSTAPMYSYIGRHGDARPVTPDRPPGSFDHGARLNRGPTAAHCSLKCRASAAHA
jgi:hypothetical protein